MKKMEEKGETEARMVIRRDERKDGDDADEVNGGDELSLGVRRRPGEVMMQRFSPEKKKTLVRIPLGCVWDASLYWPRRWV
jgi:hypothetical protein